MGCFLAPLEETVEEGEIDIEGEDDEPLKVAKDPKLPTAEAVAAHDCTHLPYRSWCKWCVQGRGRGEQHRQGHEAVIPQVGLDYFFITKGGVKTRKELEDDYNLNSEGDERLEDDRSNGNIVKAIIVRCRASKAIFAHCVPCKGADEQDYVVNKVVEDILWLGHTELILKGDNERSLQALIERVMTVVRIRTHQDVAAATPPGPSGTSRVVIDNEDAAPYSRVRLTERVGVPEVRPGSTEVDEDTATGQGEAGHNP